jgi:DNA-binding IclR family transcriptional regulator
MERRQIAELSHRVLSVAELAALLDLPLGVARVLVGDLADEGLVSVHRPVTAGVRPDPGLLERVLDGLRAI